MIAVGRYKEDHILFTSECSTLKESKCDFHGTPVRELNIYARISPEVARVGSIFTLFKDSVVSNFDYFMYPNLQDT